MARHQRRSGLQHRNPSEGGIIAETNPRHERAIDLDGLRELAGRNRGDTQLAQREHVPERPPLGRDALRERRIGRVPLPQPKPGAPFEHPWLDLGGRERARFTR